MSWVVAIDESGDLGLHSRFFAMAAIIVRRPRYLKSAYDRIPSKNFESKFYNSSPDEISSVLREIASADVRIVTSSVDKHDFKGRFYGTYGNDLYRSVLGELLENVARQIPNSDADLMLDRCRFLTLEELRNLAESKFGFSGCRLKKCEKRTSQDTPCIQVVDYVAGSIYYGLAHADSSFSDIIRQKVVVARTD